MYQQVVTTERESAFSSEKILETAYILTEYELAKDTLFGSFVWYFEDDLYIIHQISLVMLPQRFAPSPVSAVLRLKAARRAVASSHLIASAVITM